jgi:quinol monooxygenase YgiN
MNNIRKIDHARRGFFKNAGLLSISLSLPILAKGLSRKTNVGYDNKVIEIHTGKKNAVLISLFTVEPENEQKLIDLFEQGTLALFSEQPGYISSSIHKGIDDKHLVLYGQWESEESIAAMRKKPEIGEYFRQIKEVATFESIVCNDVPFIHHI